MVTSPPSYRSTVTQWIAWSILTTAAAFVSLAATAVMGFSSGIYDPDEVEGFRALPPGAHVLPALLVGGFAGLVVGAVIAVSQWRVHRRGLKEPLLIVVCAVLMSMLTCAAASPGPPEVVGRLTVDLATGLSGGMLGGLLAGLFQYLVLRRAVSVSGYWVPVTTIVWAAGWSGISALPASTSISSAALPQGINIIVPVAGGVLIGLGQWLFLRRVVQQSAWWILAWIVGWSLTVLLSGLGQLRWGVVGVVTASALVVLIRQPRVAAAASMP